VPAPDPSSPWYVPRPAGQYPLVVEDPEDHPAWLTLQATGTGDRLRIVEWESNTEKTRVTGPVVVNNPPEAPAP
jgi:hypothetical protein